LYGFAQLVKQAGILNGNDGLGGEVLEQLDLFVGERLHLLTKNDNDVVVSAELVSHLAPLLNAHPSYWKWVVIAAHSALQGAMVCVLADSTGTSVLDETAKKVLDWFNADMQ
jgi:hypothetical protein